MAILYLVSLHNGEGVRAKLVTEDGRVPHNTLYRDAAEALWHGSRWATKTTWWVDRVLVDGKAMGRSEVMDRLCDYVDSKDEGGSSFVVQTMEDIISSLRFGPGVKPEETS